MDVLIAGIRLTGRRGTGQFPPALSRSRRQGTPSGSISVGNRLSVGIVISSKVIGLGGKSAPAGPVPSRPGDGMQCLLGYDGSRGLAARAGGLPSAARGYVRKRTL